MSVVSIINDEIKLYSGMSEAAFGKTSYASIITQSGLFYDGQTISNWTFQDVRAEEVSGHQERQVVYCGKNPLSQNAKTLFQLFEAAGSKTATLEDKKTMFDAGVTVCDFLTKAAKEKIPVPKNGAGGIFVENEKLLFLPQGLFEGAVAGLPETEFSDLQGCWINSSLIDLPSVCFERAVIVYKMLTGRYPYANSNQQERNADILDKNFLPLELCINGINPQIAKEVNKALKLNSNVVAIPGKKQRGKTNEDLTPTPDFPIDLLKQVPVTTGTTKLTDEELEQKAEAFRKAQKSKVATKRAIRRNTGKIITSIIVLCVLSVLVMNYINANNSTYSSRGLTSEQTIEAFFQGVNSKDTSIIDNFSKGKTAKGILNTISQIYVINKQRKTYEKDNGFASPENWLLYLKDETFISQTGLYGVTNVMIDKKLCNLNVELHEKKDKIPALTEEKNITLTDGLQSVHQVEYFLLHTEGENDTLFIEEVKETYTLTFEKDRWIITDISTESKPLTIDSSMFFYEYFQLLHMNNGDQIRTAEMLSGKYPWLPQKHLLIKEQERLRQISENPFLFL